MRPGAVDQEIASWKSPEALDKLHSRVAGARRMSGVTSHHVRQVTHGMGSGPHVIEIDMPRVRPRRAVVRSCSRQRGSLSLRDPVPGAPAQDGGA